MAIRFVMTLLCWLALIGAASAGEAMVYLYPSPDNLHEDRHLYHWTVLEQALERTRATWGDYTLAAAPAMSETRQTHELSRSGGRVTVAWLMATPARTLALRAVRADIDHGLSGYRLLLVQTSRQSEFGRVRALTDLRAFKAGVAQGSADAELLDAARIAVTPGTDESGLRAMLSHGRFDMLPRAVDELGTRSPAPDLAIEPRLLLRLNQPTWYWFAKNEEGERLAQRVEEGLRMLSSDGALERLFDRFQRPILRWLAPARRQLIEVGAETGPGP